MTDKEKLEEAKRLYQTANADQRYVLESLFPELKEESEDERIRKAIISGMKALQEKGKYTCFANIPMDDVFAWLEKQGREKPADKVGPKFHEGCIVISNEHTDCVNSIMSITSIRNGEYLCAYKNGQMSYRFNHIEDNYHLLTLNEVINLRNPVAWNEEDENTIKVLMNIIRKSEIIDSIIYTDSLKEKLYDWLKSLRPQPKQEWSEEDEKMLNRIIEDFSDGKVSNILEVYWLKSIKQRIRG